MKLQNMDFLFRLGILVMCYRGYMAASHEGGHRRIRRSPDKECHVSYLAVSDTHSGCLQSPPRPREGVKDIERRQILDIHNTFRAKVGQGDGQPTASDMQAMVWDEELAHIAQHWARHCIYQHDDRLARSVPGRFPVGQNIAWTTIFNWEFTLNAWQGEVASFKYGQGSVNGAVVGHYTQMVWANSAKLGCGYAFCNGSRHFYVCNYGPAGNLAKPHDPDSLNKPYTTGKPGEACPNKYNRVTGLCDCGGKSCYNGGTLDVNTCTCVCPKHAWIDSSNDCQLDCSSAKDVYICEAAGGSWGYSHCQDAVNVAYDYCPITCRLCPVEGDKYFRGKGKPPTTPENHSKDPGTVPGPETSPASRPTGPSYPTPTNPRPTYSRSSNPRPSFPRPTNPYSRPTNSRPTNSRPSSTRPHYMQPSNPSPGVSQSQRPVVPDSLTKPGLPLCTKMETAKCGQPGPHGYWPTSLCSNLYIEHVCPAMCGKCVNIGCDDYERNHHEVGTSWVTPYGKMTCTLSGATHFSGCVRGDTYVRENEVYSYEEDGYKWRCECTLVNNRYTFQCLGSFGGK